VNITEEPGQLKAELYADRIVLTDSIGLTVRKGLAGGRGLNERRDDMSNREWAGYLCNCTN